MLFSVIFFRIYLVKIYYTFLEFLLTVALFIICVLFETILFPEIRPEEAKSMAIPDVSVQTTETL